MTLQNVMNISSRDPDQQHVEIYVVKEESSTMNTSASRTVMSWADVHTYVELLSGRGDVLALGSFTQMVSLGQSSQSTLAEEAPRQRMCSLFSQGECIEAGGAGGSVDPVERLVVLGETGTQDYENVGVKKPWDSCDFRNIGLGYDDGIRALDRIFWAFRPCIEGFKHCSPVIGIDGTFLYGSHNEHSNMNGKQHDLGNQLDSINIALGTLGVITTKKFGNVKVKDLIWQAGTAHQVCKFDEVMDEIKNLGTKSKSAARAYRALCNEDPTKWTLAHDKGPMDDVGLSGPIDCTVLMLQAHHRSTWIWDYGVQMRSHADMATQDFMTKTAFSYRRVHFPSRPWGVRWRSTFCTATTSTHVIRIFRDQLDRLRPDEFTWSLYDAIMHALHNYCRVASDIWVTRSPLVYFEIVEWHLPDRVCRQFGLRQVVPATHNTSPTLHGIDMRGMTRTDWTQFHREHIERWQHRREYLVVGVIDVAVMHYGDPHMVWYRCITCTLVGNPAHRPTSGNVEIGSTVKIAVTHVLREQQEIGQPTVPATPPPIPPGLPVDPPPMPPVFPVHPPPFTSSSQTSLTYVTPMMPSYTYHTSSHDVPSSSHPNISSVIPYRTTHHHIASLVAYEQCSSFSRVGDDEEFDGYVDPLLASWGQIKMPVSVEGRLSQPDGPS
ncbi:hypothetical protein Acr_27g0001990 [Actinidia rufa]|uniref:Aminotransferase-like plant mobile domain-containing protein n=1 Tax=Actinidia rufa TaxID=165716 RepID=A0A7J0H5U5_9ERIC|nr:hypothetical protein Acr_27g0001990 [Actinidia rufa]